MTITLTPEMEAKLQEKAAQEGQDINTVAQALLEAAFAWEAWDREQTIEGIKRGLEDSDAGRVRPFAEFAAEMRAKHNLPTHLSDAEIEIVP